VIDAVGGAFRSGACSGASLRRLAEVSGLDRKTVTAIVAEDVRSPD
jgi:hypothetical protein